MDETGQCFEAASRAMDAYHARDPQRVGAGGEDGGGEAQELVYARRMTAWLTRLEPQAGEALRLAVRCQHIGRWEFARSDWPEGRAGYLAWRARLAKHHAEIAGRILDDAGYDGETIARVQALVRKEKLKSDAETQRLEDVACLVFLEFYFADFAGKHDHEKVIEIVRKTWKKMSDVGQRAALELVGALPAEARGIVERAVAGGD